MHALDRRAVILILIQRPNKISAKIGVLSLNYWIWNRAYIAVEKYRYVDSKFLGRYLSFNTVLLVLVPIYIYIYAYIYKILLIFLLWFDM